MPVREFTDSSGVEWRAWEVAPDSIYPPTRGEDYLADCYQLGWVVLETKSGDRRVRVCPIPRDWFRFSPRELDAMLATGERLPAREPSARPEVSDMAAVRTFRYPGGRVWTVAVTPHPTQPEIRLLRFSAGGRSVDIEDWPANWANVSDEQLIALLRSAWPRVASAGSEDGFKRRWNDPRP